VGGLADLEARRVRFIGDPHVRIREDYLRILRFFRFHAEYADGARDRDGFDAVVNEQAGLLRLSQERVRAELLKLLAARRAVDVIGTLADSGILTLILGEVAERGRLARVASFESGDPDPVRRLAALAVQTVEDADRLRERLRLSNDEQKRLSRYGALLVILKTWSGVIDGAAVRRLVAEHGLDPVVDCLVAIKGEPKPEARPEAFHALDRFRSGAEPLPLFPLRGADLISAGIEKGPRIGDLLDEARKEWLAADCPTNPSYAASLLARTIERARGA
jgi:poly(A) polymerase